MKKLFIILIASLLVVLSILAILNLLGYHFNKNFIKEYLIFNKKQCLDQEYPTYYNHSGIEGCIFWTREGYLSKTQNWHQLFKRDDAYCNQKYGSSQFLEGYSDPKCEYEAFRDQKRKENWTYLTSKEEDGIYNYCVNKFCPSPKMFR